MEYCIPLFTIINRADRGAGLDSLPTLDVHFLQFAVECEIFSVLYQDALVVAGHHEDLFHYTVEHCEGLAVFAGGDVYTVIEREFYRLEYRVI